MTPENPLLLAGDIGGTKTTLAIFQPQGDHLTPLLKHTYPSTSYLSLGDMVREFLRSTDLKVSQASFGIAGPIFHGRATVTNLPWKIEESALSQELHAPVCLLNDLESIANGLIMLGPDDLATINTGTANPQGSKAVIAPGTGLGEAFLFWTGGKYTAFPSEGGHADFAPASPLELDLLAYLQPRLEHVSYERVCSGIGIPNIYAFFRDTGRFPEPGWLAAELDQVSDPTPVIVQAGLQHQAEICVQTVALFATVLASEAGNLALKVLATGGVYLGGGLPPRILPFLEPAAFMQIFSQKGRMSELLARIPVHIIRNPEVALIGAARYGVEAMKDHA